MRQERRAHPSELTDKIEVFRARFEKHRQTGVQANAEGVEYLIRELDEIHAQAREFREELSALRWNFEGRADQTEHLVKATLANFADPTSNVVPMLRADRSRSEGGAA